MLFDNTTIEFYNAVFCYSANKNPDIQLTSVLDANILNRC